MVCYWVVYIIGWDILRRTADGQPRVSRTAIVMWATVAITSVIGLSWESLAAWGERDTLSILDGQVWRLFTSFFLQDGGIVGTVFNLITLAITLFLAALRLPWWGLTTAFVAAGVASNVLVVFTFENDGAGNSMATMCMCLTLATYLAVTEQLRGWIWRVAVLAAIGVGLNASVDHHGFAVLLSLILGSGIAVVRRFRLGRDRRPSSARTRGRLDEPTRRRNCNQMTRERALR